MNYNHLYYFHVVASEGSLAAASKVLHVTQATISAQIKELESQLETTLFQRTPRGLRLTEAGRRTHKRCRSMFRIANQIEREFGQLAEAPQVTLEVGIDNSVSRSASRNFLLPLFQLGDVRPRVTFGDHDHLLRQITSREIDLLITSEPPEDAERRGLQEQVLWSSRLLAVAASSLKNNLIFPDFLASPPLVRFTDASQYRKIIDTFLDQHDLHPPILGETDDVTLLLMIARSGLAWVGVPEGVVRENNLPDGVEILGPLSETPVSVSILSSQQSPTQYVEKALAALLKSSNMSR